MSIVCVCLDAAFPSASEFLAFGLLVSSSVSVPHPVSALTYLRSTYPPYCLSPSSTLRLLLPFYTHPHRSYSRPTHPQRALPLLSIRPSSRPYPRHWSATFLPPTRFHFVLAQIHVTFHPRFPPPPFQTSFSHHLSSAFEDSQPPFFRTLFHPTAAIDVYFAVV